MLPKDPYYRLAFYVLTAEDAGFAFRNKMTLWIPEFNVCGCGWRCMIAFAPAGRRQKESGKEKEKKTFNPELWELGNAATQKRGFLVLKQRQHVSF